MVSYGEMIERIAESMGVGRMPLGLGFSLTPPASAVVSAVTEQPLELVRPLMESLEHELLPRDAGRGAPPVRNPPAPVRARGGARAGRMGAHRGAGGAMKVERSIEIAAPPEEVYDLIADPDRLGEWVTIHQYVDGEPPDELVEGAKMAQCLRLAGRNFKVKWTVVESDRPNRLVWEGRGPVRSKAKVVNELKRNRRRYPLLLHERVLAAGRPAGQHGRARWSAG